MKHLPHYLVTSFFLLLAMACYILGTTKGVAIFILAGFLFELYFWFRVLNRIRKRQSI